MSSPSTPDDIFAKIKSQGSDPTRLSSFELARLQAWLKRNPFQNTLSELRRIANGDKATQDAVQIRKDWHSHLEATVQWNLAEYAKPQAVQTAPPDAKQAEGGKPSAAISPPAADQGDEGTPPAGHSKGIPLAETAPQGAKQAEGDKPTDGHSKGIPLAEAEILVREWLAANAKANPAAITRDAVAAGTGVSGASVSRTAAWRAFGERRDAETRPVARNVPLSDTLKATISTGNVGKAESAQRNAISNEVAELIEEQQADEAEQDRRRK